MKQNRKKILDALKQETSEVYREFLRSVNEDPIRALCEVEQDARSQRRSKHIPKGYPKQMFKRVQRTLISAEFYLPVEPKEEREGFVLRYMGVAYKLASSNLKEWIDEI